MIEKFEILPRPDTFNVNRRYYTKEAIETALEEYRKRISDGDAPVMMGVPSYDNSFDIDRRHVIGQVIDIQFKDDRYMSTVHFDRPTKEVSQILDSTIPMVVGLNQMATINENNEITDFKIVSVSLIPDPRLEIDPIEDLQYFVNQFKSRPFDYRIRNQLVTIIDAIYSNEKIKRELKNEQEKARTQENT